MPVKSEEVKKCGRPWLAGTIALFCSAHCSDFLHTVGFGNRYNPARARKDE
jgi:hypothetical protein